MAVFMEAIEEAHSLDRHGVRERAAEEFDTDRIVDCVVQALGASLRHCGGPFPSGIEFFRLF